MRVRIVIDSIDADNDELRYVLAAHRNAIKFADSLTPKSIEAADHADFNFAMDVANMGAGFNARSIAMHPAQAAAMLRDIAEIYGDERYPNFD